VPWSTPGRLVDDLLTLAKAERTDFLRPEPIDLAPFVAELWDGLSLTAERRFEVGPVPDGTLEADPDRLAQALRNLAGNAIAHTTAPDGLVRLEVNRATPGGIRFTVLDDGPGIPEATRATAAASVISPAPARSPAAGLAPRSNSSCPASSRGYP
jgi:two-component system, OmpR family, sensor kinase